MNRRIRLLVADDHAVVREGLIRILQHEDDLEVVAEAENGLATLRKVREFQPDVLLLDIAMPECNGMEVLQVLRKEGSGAAVVVLSMYDNESYIREVFRSGAAGYVLKASDVAEICQAIRAAARGELFLSNEIRRKVVKGFLDYAPASAMQTRFDALSAQERKVLILLARGKSNKEIADELFLSVKTIEKHRTAIGHKLGISSRVALTHYAIEIGLLDLLSGPDLKPEFGLGPMKK